MTSTVSAFFPLGESSRWAEPTKSVPTDGGTTIGAAARTPNAPRLLITTGAFIDLQICRDDAAKPSRNCRRKRRLARDLTFHFGGRSGPRGRRRLVRRNLRESFHLTLERGTLGSNSAELLADLDRRTNLCFP